MLCDDCKKNEACVHITQIGPNGKVDKNLCESCAAKYEGYLFPSRPDQAEKSISMDDFLQGIFSSAQPEQKDNEVVAEHGSDLVCPNCGMGYEDFLHTGKIGCSVCYETFGSQLEPILRRIHGSSTHTGKIPHRSGGALTLKHEIEELKKKLTDAVKQEAYEDAAIYRDKVRALEKQLAEDGKEES